MSVAVVTAYNPRNAGMYSVDLAAQRYFRAAGRPYRLYRMLHGRRGPFLIRGERVRRLTDPAKLLAHDAIVYWGDFQNSPVYATQDFHEREEYYARAPHPLAASIASWRRHFLLDGIDRGTRKLLSVSNNFQSGGAALSVMDGADARAISALLDRFDGIFPRDPASTREVQAMLGPSPRARVETGVDAAVLNRPSGYIRPAAARRTFTWFFRRSGLTQEEELRLVEAVATATGLRPVHLRNWLRLNFLTWDWQFSRFTGQLGAAAFCLSDTYHCLINAMVQDTPVLGLGRPAAAQAGTLGDYKKRELFDMFGLSDWFVDLDAAALSDATVTQVAERARLLTGGATARNLYAPLDARADAYRALLAQALA